MPTEQQQQLSPAELAELRQRFPRISWWFGAAPHHPDIHRDHTEPNGQGNSTPHGSFYILRVRMRLI
jgi:hypothetical protein